MSSSNSRGGLEKVLEPYAERFKQIGIDALNNNPVERPLPNGLTLKQAVEAYIEELLLEVLDSVKASDYYHKDDVAHAKTELLINLRERLKKGKS